MNNIFYKHTKLQALMWKQSKAAINPLLIQGGINYSVGDIYDFIQQMKFCMDEEVTELLEALGDNTRAIHKPWHKAYCELRNKPYATSDSVKEEAIDMLCFAVNICLAAGITDKDVNFLYDKVNDKIMHRLENGHETKLG